MSAAADVFPLPQRRRVAGVRIGAMRSVRRGAGSDLAGSRPYVPGDDVRTIDRHASARLSSARGQDEWIVRQTYADQAARVVIVADRRPSMALFPPGLPWLCKPAALAAATAAIARSAAAAACLSGYLELAGEGAPLWLAPGRARREQLEQAAAGTVFRAPAETLDRALEYLALRTRLPAGSFVFVVSDFLAPPRDETLAEALVRRWQLVPVIVQDPLWERSFPQVAGALLPLGDPGTGHVRAVRFTRRDVRARREHNEERWRRTVERLASYELEPVVVDSHRPGRVLEAFRSWAERSGGVPARL